MALRPDLSSLLENCPEMFLTDMARTKSNSTDSGLNFEAQLWAAAEQAVPALNREESEYKGARPEGLVLGLIFLKYISDAFEEKREQLLFSFSDPKSEWFIKDEPGRKEAVDERDEYLISIPTGLHHSAQGCRVGEATLGNVIYYFPQPQRGCISGDHVDGCNPFRVVEFLERFPRVAHSSQPRAERHSPVGAKTFRSIDANLGPRNADSFRSDLHPDLKADFILVTATRASAKTTLAKPDRRSIGETELHPPFNMSDWGGEHLRQDVRWKFGIPPVNNTNYAWIQHFIHHLSPVGVAGFVMANGSISTQTSNEGEIRKAIRNSTHFTSARSNRWCRILSPVRGLGCWVVGRSFTHR